MAISIGINGFGRIGRVALRIAINQPDTFKVCGINVRNADLGYMKYMIRYDSTFGRFQGELDTYENGLIIEGQKIPVFSESDAALIPWGACGAEYIIDATGNCDVGFLSNCNFINKDNENQPTTLRFIMSGVDLDKFGMWIESYDNDRNVTTVANINNQIHLSTAYTWDLNKKWALKPLFDKAVADRVIEDTDRNYFQLFSIAGMPNSIAFNCPRIIADKAENPLNSEVISKNLMLARKSILRLSNFCRKYLVGFENAYISSMSSVLGVRVSRRIKGKYIYTYDDIKNSKKFKNPVLVSDYPVDVHSTDKNASILEQLYAEYQLPVESLMSADIDNLFVVGRCISADFMAQGAIRIIPSCFSMGEGLAKYMLKNL